MADSGNRQAEPGWYADPRDVRLQRYWDGRTWTEHTAPRETAPTVEPWRYTGPQTSPNKTLIIAGWITAFLVFPVGLVIGILLATKDETQHAVGIVLVSLLVGLLFLLT